MDFFSVALITYLPLHYWILPKEERKGKLLKGLVYTCAFGFPVSCILLFLVSPLVYPGSMALLAPLRFPVSIAVYVVVSLAVLDRQKKGGLRRFPFKPVLALFAVMLVFVLRPFSGSGPWENSEVRALGKEAAAHFEAGEFAEAVEAFTRLIDKHPDAAPAYAGRGFARVILEENKDAIKDFDKAIELRPAMPGVRFGRCVAFTMDGHMEEAEKDCRDAVDTPFGDDSVEFRRLRAVIQVRLGDLKGAEADARRVEEKRGAWSQEAMEIRASILLAKREFPEALALLEKAVHVHPSSADLLNDLAWALVVIPEDRYRDPKRGLEAAEKALAMRSKPDLDVLDTLACAQAALGDFPKAVETAQSLRTEKRLREFKERKLCRDNFLWAKKEGTRR